MRLVFRYQLRGGEPASVAVEPFAIIGYEHPVPREGRRRPRRYGGTRVATAHRRRNLWRHPRRVRTGDRRRRTPGGAAAGPYIAPPGSVMRTVVELAVMTGIPVQSIAALDGDSLATMIDVVANSK